MSVIYVYLLQVKLCTAIFKWFNKYWKNPMVHDWLNNTIKICKLIYFTNRYMVYIKFALWHWGHSCSLNHVCLRGRSVIHLVIFSLAKERVVNFNITFLIKKHRIQWHFQMQIFLFLNNCLRKGCILLLGIRALITLQYLLFVHLVISYIPLPFIFCMNYQAIISSRGWSVNYRHWSKYSRPPVSINEILLAHKYTHLYTWLFLCYSDRVGQSQGS